MSRQRAEVVPIADTVRAVAANRIIIGYLGILAVGVLLIAGYAYFAGAWEKAIGFLFELLKIAVIPVITFVLGYYFGTAAK